ncbi:hypothetical protein [Thermomonospora cellulosilytica]|uniref:Nucleotide exchange factor GrpE n=1 Tax=Thermomonospora cellulosilytica TaxID=1411118 RepID=A0A7W3MTG5_9ACTN|nr:hypothetical protein [Thermomonospora cellulosilytica]MBA9001585.1 hypothetical protein [Thermomonospora cellulosilytica]
MQTERFWAGIGAAFRQWRQPREFRIAPAAWPRDALSTLEKLASALAESAPPPEPSQPADTAGETAAPAPPGPAESESGSAGSEAGSAGSEAVAQAPEALPDRTLAELATNVWRLHTRLGRDEDTPRIVMRHLEGALDALADAGVEIRDHLGEPYDPGLTLEVLTLQPTPGLGREEVIETLRPSVYFRDRAIQRAEVIVGTPLEPGAPDEPGGSGEPGLPQPTRESRP